MMKRFNFNSATKAMLGAGILSLLLAGCGSDGKDGEPGQPGVVGVNIDSTPTLNATFTNATVDAGKVTVDFSLTNANGVAVLGLTKDHDIRFGIAQLTHTIETVGPEGEQSQADRGFLWQSYINELSTPTSVPEGVEGLSPSNQFEANVEAASQCDTCLVDHGDGTYSYTYQTQITTVTEPIAITYDADSTQRVTLELELPQLAENAHFDWQPSTGMTEGIQTRDVVSIETCYTCHEPESLKLHGGRRVDIENCVACHTSTSGDPESGNTIDFTYMIHAIHKGQDRVNRNGEPVPYKIVGYGGKVIDYGNVTFPQKPAADCAACHVEGEGAPANADLFKADLSTNACEGCHTERHHADEQNCVACHNAQGPGRSAEKAHGDIIAGYDLAEQMNVVFTNVVGQDAGKLNFNVQVLDKDGAPVDSQFVDTSSRVIASWYINGEHPDYTDASYSNRRVSLSAGTYDAANKIWNVTVPASLPASVNGLTVELFSALDVCVNDVVKSTTDAVLVDCSTTEETEEVPATGRKITVKADLYKTVLGDTAATPESRRVIIDPAKCQGCHNQEIHHYDNGVNCQTCHTSDKTLKTDDSYPGGQIPSSFAWKAHEREGHYLKYAGVQSGTVLKTNCSTCHAEVSSENSQDGIQLGRVPERVWRYGDTKVPGAEIWVSSDAGACLSCHQKYMDDSTRSHIQTNGGIIDGTDAADVRQRASESCSTCHTPTQLRSVHGN